jgi:hypothetical protein
LTGVLSPTFQVRSSQRSEPTAWRWLIAPVGGRAEIGAGTSLTDLVRLFGAANVREGKIHLGEGDYADGTLLYSHDPVRRVEIVWKDESRHAPATLRVRGKKSMWGIAPGISVGTSLKDIERFNGCPFTLAGFGWDYSGTITNWNGGRLASLRTGLPHAFIRLEPSSGADTSLAADYGDVLGDHDFSSRRGAMQRLNPRVYEFIVSFEAARHEKLANTQMEPARR